MNIFTRSIFSMRHRPSSRLRRCPAAGFTLAELLISMTVVGLLSGMLAGFYINTTKYTYLSEQKMTINKDMRTITQWMSDDARMANFFVLYASYAVSSRTTASQELLQANSGDFLVFVFYGTPPAGTPVNVRPVIEVVGYYREPYSASNQLAIDPITGAPANLQPVHRFDLTVANGGIPAASYLESVGIPSGATSTTIEALLPNDAAATIASHPIVIQLAKGLADGCLFHNFWGRSVMINGQIVQGNNFMNATNTYNFTVSPRG